MSAAGLGDAGARQTGGVGGSGCGAGTGRPGLPIPIPLRHGAGEGSSCAAERGGGRRPTPRPRWQRRARVCALGDAPARRSHPPAPGGRFPVIGPGRRGRAPRTAASHLGAAAGRQDPPGTGDPPRSSWHPARALPARPAHCEEVGAGSPGPWAPPAAHLPGKGPALHPALLAATLPGPKRSGDPSRRPFSGRAGHQPVMGGRGQEGVRDEPGCGSPQGGAARPKSRFWGAGLLLKDPRGPELARLANGRAQGVAADRGAGWAHAGPGARAPLARPAWPDSPSACPYFGVLLGGSCGCSRF